MGAGAAILTILGFTAIPSILDTAMNEIARGLKVDDSSITRRIQKEIQKFKSKYPDRTAELLNAIQATPYAQGSANLRQFLAKEKRKKTQAYEKEVRRQGRMADVETAASNVKSDLTMKPIMNRIGDALTAKIEKRDTTPSELNQFKLSEIEKKVNQED